MHNLVVLISDLIGRVERVRVSLRLEVHIGHIGIVHV